VVETISAVKLAVVYLPLLVSAVYVGKKRINQNES